MLKKELTSLIRQKGTYLCVGLDPDISKMPPLFSKDAKGIGDFCIEIIKATAPYCVAYKPNLAFFEIFGSKGWEALERVMDAVPDDIFTIADAKRGDIGNTSKVYAKTFFNHFDFDAVTIAPYMGIDSVSPFLEFDDKWVILLGLTSNKGSQDFQMLQLKDDTHLYEEVLKRSQDWGNCDNLMYVIGATHPDMFQKIRDIVPDHFLLVPGVGAQGGKVSDVAKYGINDDIGLLINSSRSIIYASQGDDFVEAAVREAKQLGEEMMATL